MENQKVRYYVGAARDCFSGGQWLPMTGCCQSAGSAHGARTTRTIFVTAGESPKDTDYQKYTEITEQEAFTLAGKSEIYSVAVCTDDLLPKLFFLKPGAWQKKEQEQDFEKALTGGYIRSKAYEVR